MSLYWHVADKDHLLDLMIDGVEGEQDVGEATADWQADLARLARQQRQGLLRHPWVLDFLGGRPLLGPRIILRLEQSLALLDNLGLNTRTGLDVLMTLNTYVLGAVIRELQEMRDEPTDTTGPARAVRRRRQAVAGAAARFGSFHPLLADLRRGHRP